MSSPSPYSSLLIDGNALLHRFWHAIPPLTAPDGRMVNSVYGFAGMVESLLERYRPTHMAVAWDLPQPTFRHELYTPYKAQRKEKEPELYAQIPWIQELLEAYGVRSVSVPGYEADDVIGTLSRVSEEAHHATGIVTGDMDTLQLVSPLVHILAPQKGTREFLVYTPEFVEQKYGLTPAQWIDYKTLLGDPSDNLKGVEGIGPKNAQNLLQKHDNLDEICRVARQGEIPGKIGERLRDATETIALMRTLVTIVRSIPIELEMETYRLPPLPHARIADQLTQLGFKSLLKRHQWVEAPPIDALPSSPSAAPENATPATSSEVASIAVPLPVNDSTEIERFFETNGYLIVAPASYVSPHKELEAAWLISDGSNDIFATTEALQAISESKWITISSLLAIDIKRLWHVVPASHQVTTFDDWLLVAYLCVAGMEAYTLTNVLERLHLPTSQTHGSTLQQSFKVMSAWLEKEQMTSLYQELEKPLLSVLFEMERSGILLDRDALNVFSITLSKDIAALETQMQTLAGTSFNPQSPAQLADLLFETLHLPTKGIKKTKTGYSTAASELEKILDLHPIVPLILEYRERTKLRSTYVDVLPTLCDNEGRIHTTFHQTVAATGRLSSSDPNLQNIPIKTALGQEIRRAFIAPKGRVLLSADFSQIELRLAAILAKDEPFLQAFRDGVDIHTRTAAETFETTEAEVTPELRRAAKAINFGILYGMGARALGRSTGKTTKEAEVILERYFEIHHALRAYMDRSMQYAREHGYVETLVGRRRYLPDIHSGSPLLRSGAERMAINMPIQGTQADLLKKAMLQLHVHLRQMPNASLLLQVHDELVVEVDKEAAEPIARLIKQTMENVAQYPIPLTVQVKQGSNWGDMKQMDL